MTRFFKTVGLIAAIMILSIGLVHLWADPHTDTTLTPTMILWSIFALGVLDR